MLRSIPFIFILTLGTINSAFGDTYGGTSLDYGIPHAGKDRAHGSIIIGKRFSQDNYQRS